MFWGITLEGGKKYTQVLERSFHVTMAALGFSNANPDPVSVMVDINQAQFILCTLQAGKIPQQPLSLEFTEGEEVSFSIEGDGEVHLTGYLLPEPQEYEFSSDEDENEDFLLGEGEEDTDDEGDEVDEEPEEEEKEEEPEVEPELKSKTQKKVKPSGKKNNEIKLKKESLKSGNVSPVSEKDNSYTDSQTDEIQRDDKMTPTSKTEKHATKKKNKKRKNRVDDVQPSKDDENKSSSSKDVNNNSKNEVSPKKKQKKKK